MVIVRSVPFLFDDIVVRSGEIGEVIEYDYFIISPDKPLVIDYIVKVGTKTLFFYEDELAPYPETKE